MKITDYFWFEGEIDDMDAEEFAAMVVAKAKELGGAKAHCYDDGFWLTYEREETAEEEHRRLNPVYILTLYEEKIVEAKELMKKRLSEGLWYKNDDILSCR